MDQGSQRNLGGGIGIDATLNKKSIAQPSSSASQQASTLPRIRSAFPPRLDFWQLPLGNRSSVRPTIQRVKVTISDNILKTNAELVLFDQA